MDQEQLEEIYSEKKAREYVHNLLLSNDVGMDSVVYGVELLAAWCDIPATYDTKTERKNTLKNMDLGKVVERVFIDMLMLRQPTTLANMATTLGVSLGFQEAKQGITLAGEIIAILQNTGFYELVRTSKYSSYWVLPNMQLNDEEYAIAHRGMYMPPMIGKPKYLKHNRSTPYHTLKGDSLILGGQINHHDYEISYDVLNKQNNIKLSLNIDFIDEIEEEATFSLDEVSNMDKRPTVVNQDLIRLKRQNWYIHLEQCDQLYRLMYEEGNVFYIPNKPDKRGRIYSQGHHINPMGNSYKKSSIELHHKETVNIPEGFFNAS